MTYKNQPSIRSKQFESNRQESRRPTAMLLTSILLFFLLAVPPSDHAYADSVEATITVFRGGHSIGANPNTDRIYVSHHSGHQLGAVTVINGTDNSVMTELILAGATTYLAVNPNTNKIYVSQYYCKTWYDCNRWISVIDGNTNAVIKTIVMPDVDVLSDINRFCLTYFCFLERTEGFGAIGINPATNKIYAASSAGLVVIDGTIDVVVDTLAVPIGPVIAVNPVTNRIYTTGVTLNEYDSHEYFVAVIDGATGTVISRIPILGHSLGVGINPNTNMIYASNYYSSRPFTLGNTVSVINGTTNTLVATVTIPVGAQPLGVEVNPVTNKIYVANQYSTAYDHNPTNSTVSVIDGSTNTVVDTLWVTRYPYNIAILAHTSRVYVSHMGGELTLRGGKVTVIDGSTPFDFSVSFEPASATVIQGQTATAMLSINLLTEPSQTVSLSASGLPLGASATFTRQSGNPSFSSTMEIATLATTPAGTYEITVTGTAAGD